MKIYILTDNIVRKRGFLAEHGLSILIVSQGQTFLFDTGQSDVYCKNAERMGLDLRKTDAIILSHGHYDHCGGLPCFPASEFPPIYVHPDAFRPRFAVSRDLKNYRQIGVPWTQDEMKRIRSHIVPIRKPTRIASGAALCPGIPYAVDFECAPKGFYVGDGNSKRRDLFRDEQVLVLEEKGLCVFLGCSHPGVANCLRYVSALFPGRRIRLVMGGMHLETAGPQRLKETLRFFKDLHVERIVPLHCTGLPAIAEMKRQLGDRCLLLDAGGSMDLD